MYAPQGTELHLVFCFELRIKMKLKKRVVSVCFPDFNYIKMFNQFEFLKLAISALTRPLHSCETSRHTIIIIIIIIMELAWYLHTGGLNRVGANMRMWTFSLHRQRSPIHQSRYRNARNISSDCNRISLCMYNVVVWSPYKVYLCNQKWIWFSISAGNEKYLKFAKFIWSYKVLLTSQYKLPTLNN
jgi:hypothetical protein